MVIIMQTNADNLSAQKKKIQNIINLNEARISIYKYYASPIHAHTFFYIFYNAYNCLVTKTNTISLLSAFHTQVGREVAHPGVANDFNDEDAKKYYTYYQWVCFVLFFQVCKCLPQQKKTTQK